jgi:uncharacterized membrane protein
MLELIVIILALGMLLGFVVGIVLQAWRTARCTGQPLSTILRGGGNGEER